MRNTPHMLVVAACALIAFGFGATTAHYGSPVHASWPEPQLTPFERAMAASCPVEFTFPSNTLDGELLDAWCYEV